MSTFDHQLRVAFANTHFTALLPDGPILLRVGIPSTALQSHMVSINAKFAAYITAYNPYSVVVSTDDNIQANHRLEQTLIHSHLPYWPCVGQDPESQWPSEPGYLILGADRRWLRKVGRRFRQHALLICHQTGRPKLLWTRHSS